MDSAVGESSSIHKVIGETKPVIVRVKRKVCQSPLDAFWLEINERPFKKPFLDFSKLSISNSEPKEEDVKPKKKVLVRHLETVTDSETTIDIIHSLFESDVNEHSCSNGKLEERKLAFKRDNRKEHRLTKAVQQQQIAAGNARFEQIWRSRKGNEEGIRDKELHEKCSFYDVIRVDAEERPKEEPELTSLEDQKLLASFLPLLRECIPTAAEEIEADIDSSLIEEYVYDYYAVNNDENMDISEDSSKHQFPLVKVEEEEEFFDESDGSDYDSDDSNAEEHPKNDYPDEISEDEEEDEEEEEESEENDEEEREEGSSDESEDAETAERHVRRVIGDDEFDDYMEDMNVYGEKSDEEDEFY